MQIKIEIDVKPEELRRFLGLPDVAGLQEDVIAFLREKVGAASENFDPASFVKDNLQTLRDSSAWRKIVAATKVNVGNAATGHAAPARKNAAKQKGPARRKPRPANAGKPGTDTA